MEAQAPQLGTYQIYKAYYEVHNGKPVPMAEAIFIGLGWSKFDYKPRKLRLQGLYNPSSIGPKDEFPKENIQALYLHMVHVVDKIERPHPDNPNKTQYSLVWEAYKPSNYDELIQQDMELLSDFYVKDQNNALNEGELQAIEMDELIGVQAQLETLGNDDLDEEPPLDEDDYKIK